MLLAKQKQVARLVAAINEIDAVQESFETSVRKAQGRGRRGFLKFSPCDRLRFDHHRVWVLKECHWAHLSKVFEFLSSAREIDGLLAAKPALEPQWQQYRAAYAALHKVLCDIRFESQAYLWPLRSKKKGFKRPTDPVGVSLVAAVMAARRVFAGWSLRKACLLSRKTYAKYNRKGSHHRRR